MPLPTTADFTIGVEEEFFLAEPETGRLLPRAREITGTHDGFDDELHQALVESGTPVCSHLEELRDAVLDRRSRLARIASRRDLLVISAGTAPRTDLDAQRVTDTGRFHRMLDEYQLVAREQLIAAAQTHVGFVDRDEAVAVMARVRPWISVLLALTASSPFFDGRDTGFASYRAQIWSRWPTSGMPATFESWQHYRSVVSSLVAAGLVADEKMIYTWLRPSLHVPTLEFRIADAASTVEEAVMVAGLSRALAVAEATSLRDGRDALQQRPEVLDLGVWQASRHGLDDGLSDPLASPVSGAMADSETVVTRLLEHVDRHLGDEVERRLVVDAVDGVLRHGNSAARQRSVLQRRHDLADVSHALAREFLGASSPA